MDESKIASPRGGHYRVHVGVIWKSIEEMRTPVHARESRESRISEEPPRKLERSAREVLSVCATWLLRWEVERLIRRSHRDERLLG